MRHSIPPLTVETLRRKAEVAMLETREEAAFTNALDLASVVEDLRIHQVELEIQNDELQEARTRAEELQKRYFRHFDLAPVGMIRLSSKGIVLEANILGAAMLGIERIRFQSGKVVFAAHVAHESQEIFHLHLKNAPALSKMDSCEISLRNRAGEETFVRMQTVGSHGVDDTMDLLVTLTDLTELKRAEDAVAALNAELEGRVLNRTEQLNVAYKTLEGTIEERRKLETEILAVSEREQRRFGQDLHDDLCQRLAGLSLLGGVLAESLRKGGMGPAAAKAEDIAGLLDSSVLCARDVARGLHPVNMDAEGLMAALSELAIRANREVKCRFESLVPVFIANHMISLNFYRIAQEAVTNALKHARATEIVISLDEKRDLLVLKVSDNGTGLLKTPDSKSMGFHLMSYRAAMIGAILRFKKRSGGGTQVFCSLQAAR